MQYSGFLEKVSIVSKTRDKPSLLRITSHTEASNHQPSLKPPPPWISKERQPNPFRWITVFRMNNWRSFSTASTPLYWTICFRPSSTHESNAQLQPSKQIFHRMPVTSIAVSGVWQQPATSTSCCTTPASATWAKASPILNLPVNEYDWNKLLRGACSTPGPWIRSV